jgi:hypothetical protein
LTGRFDFVSQAVCIQEPAARDTSQPTTILRAVSSITALRIDGEHPHDSLAHDSAPHRRR